MQNLNEMPPQIHQMTNDEMIKVLLAIKEHKQIEWQQKFGMSDKTRIWHKCPYPLEEDCCLNFCGYNYRVVEEET